jgi:3-methyladenine DNA glycosylase AlkD
MESITRKPLVKEAVVKSLQAFDKKGPPAFTAKIYDELLSKKIRFPLLEYAAGLIFEKIPFSKQLAFCDAIVELHTIGGNTLVGKILQLRSGKKLNESLSKAVDYILSGDQWYVCDIIGERVMGYNLLVQPGKMIPVLKKYAKHEDKWIVRTIGVATHFAVKKGLKKKDAETMFGILLSLANTTDFHTKKGIGWAAKTIAKFHPDIIAKNKTAIYENPEVKQWFKTKIKIGLGRTGKYAGKYK